MTEKPPEKRRWTAERIYYTVLLGVPAALVVGLIGLVGYVAIMLLWGYYGPPKPVNIGPPFPTFQIGDTFLKIDNRTNIIELTLSDLPDQKLWDERPWDSFPAIISELSLEFAFIDGRPQGNSRVATNLGPPYAGPPWIMGGECSASDHCLPNVWVTIVDRKDAEKLFNEYNNADKLFNYEKIEKDNDCNCKIINYELSPELDHKRCLGYSFFGKNIYALYVYDFQKLYKNGCSINKKIHSFLEEIVINPENAKSVLEPAK